jgi:hypothetical protein
MNTPIECYLSDALKILIERAQDARRLSNQMRRASSPDASFEAGRALAYYEVISMLLNHAPTFGLTTHEIPELGFDADKELLARDELA